MNARSIDIEPSDDLRNSPHSEADAISVADSMLIAALRDAENALVDIEGDERSSEGDVSRLEGYSFPGAMKTWTFEILGFDETDLELCWSSGEIDTMLKADKTWSKGGVAFLNIDSNLLNGKPAGEGNFLGVHMPDHWVAFHGGLALDLTTGEIYFECYSWGRIYPILMKQEQFSEYLYDVVLGER